MNVSGDKTFEMRVVESKHREEVLTLRKKLQWISENQELQDRDANRLKAATAEIHQLKDQVLVSPSTIKFFSLFVFSVFLLDFSIVHLIMITIIIT